MTQMLPGHPGRKPTRGIQTEPWANEGRLPRVIENNRLSKAEYKGAATNHKKSAAEAPDVKGTLRKTELRFSGKKLYQKKKEEEKRDSGTRSGVEGKTEKRPPCSAS